MWGDTDTARFAAGGADPYTRMLEEGSDGVLRLRRLSSGTIVEEWDFVALGGSADGDDVAALGRCEGPLLDVGCGPGRMVRAAAERASAAMGIDVSPAAVRRARAHGTPALERSIFDRLPLEGRWRTVLLMDGNIGIGGDPRALLERCRDLLAPGGALVIEADPDEDLDERSLFTVVDAAGLESEAFPWARVGWRTVMRAARAAGLSGPAHMRSGERHFVRAVAPRRPISTAAAATQTAATHRPTSTSG
ncbi:methyltransferase domain-containing protein [Microbacterium aquimaris]|uniref:class I SAM-dependent methyltransferase n=1 Tax=Microbacterium aquimaris TaxID=459816 RepID=UPI002AD4F544|nr:methyltransferase domain-containing protein [Microbacterium aquimaris]MDZ8275938.1 methyltransferase domain-containing protein [Microbacterium aquimaris]